MVKVSIITPVYNVEECIEKNIKSIISQTCKDFELLLIDDGSKDRSIEIARELLETSDINYKIISQKNSGVSTARNRGIEEANGEYISFLDSDDYIDSRYVELMYEKAITNDCDVVFCDYSEVDGDGKILAQSSTNFLDDFIEGKEGALRQLNGEINLGMRSAIYRTLIIKGNNLEFDSNRKYAEDMVFIVKALLYAKKVISVDEVLAYYVRWDAAVTRTASLKHLDCYYSYVDLLKYIKEIGDLREIEEFLIQFKIPYSISHIFSTLCREEKFHEDLFRFLKQDDVSQALKKYKLQKFDKNNIRYLIQCKGMKCCPNLLLKAFNIILR
ncbi:glycosyltransferase family 2 protein [Clostridium uliginosum]|uniref:glycosyltransferase family 2 protein n=1 Tax=Clostridium uliginosum TaxID=119641 RepID=UPI000B7E2E55|nr:glycosyltransferase [Clostridium uliginosum]